MKSNRTFPVLACLIVFALSPAKGEETLEEALSNCALIGSDEDRLSCFDALTRDAVSAAEDADPSPGVAPAAGPEAPEAGTAARPLNDDVALPKTDDEEKPRAVSGAELAGCEVEESSRRTVFLLDNGQVWRQSGSEDLDLRDCRGRAEITRDFFGYKLRIVDENRTIRVRRVR